MEISAKNTKLMTNNTSGIHTEIKVKMNPKNYPITSCPSTHLHQRLSLEVTDFVLSGL